jgi:hypothetical protein
MPLETRSSGRRRNVLVLRMAKRSKIGVDLSGCYSFLDGKEELDLCQDKLFGPIIYMQWICHQGKGSRDRNERIKFMFRLIND